jgi:hypothetical protein
MYRPTVRYDDKFKDYVEGLFHSTSLDRNQIIRLGLFLLGHTKEGRDVLQHFASSPLPKPNWNKNDMVLWYGDGCNFTFEEQGAGTPEGGTSDVKKDSLPRSEGQATRSEHWEIHEETTSKKRIKYIARVGDATTILYER